MSRTAKLRQSVLFCLTIFFLLIFFCTSTMAGQVEPPLGIQEKLDGISEEEKTILQKLFILTQEIAVTELEEKKLAQEIYLADKEIKGLEAAIKEEEITYTKKQQALKLVLKSYQRMGPGSYLEIMMDSDSLAALLRRVNTLRDITRNTGELLKQLEQSKEKLSAEKEKLAGRYVLIEEKQQQAKKSLTEKLSLKKELEEYLASLKGQKEYYQAYLSNIQKLTEELKPLLAKLGSEFSGLVEAGKLPPDIVKISFSLFNVRGYIEDKSLNEIISKQPSLSELVFAFEEDKVQISLPSRKLVLSGSFVVEDGNLLSFQAREGSFYGMPLELEYIEELFGGENLVLELKPLLGSNTLKAIKIRKGYLELFIKPDLF